MLEDNHYWEYHAVISSFGLNVLKIRQRDIERVSVKNAFPNIER